jgi:F420-dependent oxidoreductase-like protein
MDVGVLIPQGWTGEYDGWDADRAWKRTVWLAQQADDLGFESIWLFDHFHTVPVPTDEITFEAFTGLSALAALTTRARLGHMVTCAGYRNPALVAKMIATMDVISGGRIDFGVGAGWKEDEWRAYGYGFPSLRERQTRLRDALEISRQMLRQTHATYAGETASVTDAINIPQPVQRPSVPIVVGGNGQRVTWGLAAKYADELNLDGMQPDEVREVMPVIAERCREVGRDPSTLPVSIHIWWDRLRRGDPRALLEGYREAGVSRAITLVKSAATDDEALPKFRAAAVDSGATMGDARPAVQP